MGEVTKRRDLSTCPFFSSFAALPRLLFLPFSALALFFFSAHNLSPPVGNQQSAANGQWLPASGSREKRNPAKPKDCPRIRQGETFSTTALLLTHPHSDRINIRGPRQTMSRSSITAMIPSPSPLPFFGAPTLLAIVMDWTCAPLPVISLIQITPNWSRSGYPPSSKAPMHESTSPLLNQDNVRGP